MSGSTGGAHASGAAGASGASGGSGASSQTGLTPLVEAARGLGARHKANRAGDMVIYCPDYGTEGADHGRGAEVACVSVSDYTVIGHEDDGDYRNLGSFSTPRSALEAALSFVRAS